jgi:hypothetical protein
MNCFSIFRSEEKLDIINKIKTSLQPLKEARNKSMLKYTQMKDPVNPYCVDCLEGF